jgi:hypothetical protein
VVLGLLAAILVLNYNNTNAALKWRAVLSNKVYKLLFLCILQNFVWNSLWNFEITQKLYN